MFSLTTYPWLEPICLKLFQSYKSKQFSHAQLLMGPQGLGQLQLVNYLVQLLLCSEKTATPCNRCKACYLSANNTHPDLYWISLEDKASTIKIDQIREALQSTEEMAQLGNAKVIVITHVDKMTINAANALLKRLEEPTQNTYFLLLAETSYTIPRTIISRCAYHILKKPSMFEAKQWLEAQNLKTDDLELLYSLSLGSPEVMKSFIDEVSITQIKKVLAGILSFLNKEMSLSTVIKELLLLPINLRWSLLIFWLQAYSKIFFINNLDTDIQAMQAFLPKESVLSQENVYKCYEYCLEMISMSSKTHLNEQLLFENILILLLKRYIAQ